MTDIVFLDTNVIVYAFDKNNKTKNEKALIILNDFYLSDHYKVSTQVIQEFSNIAQKKLLPPLPINEITVFIDTIPISNIIEITTETIKKALFVCQRFQLSFWDSMIIAAAIINDCNIVLSEDLSDGMKIESVVITNPFK